MFFKMEFSNVFTREILHLLVEIRPLEVKATKRLCFELCIEVLHGRNNENVLHEKEYFFPQEKEFIVPAMQHGCRVKPLDTFVI